MQHDADKQDDRLRPVKVDEDLVLELNFVPAWARKPASAGQLSIYDGRGDDDRRGRGGRDRRGPRDAGRGRKPERGRESPRPDRGPPQSPAGAPRPPQRSGPDTHGHARPREDFRRELEPLPPVSVRFLPEQRQLAAVVQQIAGTRRAYPLVDLAALLLNQEGACYVRIEVQRGAEGVSLHQCKRCQYLALDADTLKGHVLRAHFDDWFDAEETESEAPGGAFVCVARCGLSGELIGPPNHHLYAETLRELHATRYPHMDFDAYKAKVRLSHAAEDIEAWRTAASRRTVYQLKDTPPEAEAPAPMTRAEAESTLRTNLLDGVVVRTRKAGVPESVARQISDPGLLQAIREAWRKEHRFPLQLSIALRAAFRHKHLYFFKAGRNVQFVTAVPPAPLEPEHAIESIRVVLDYLREHPGCSRAELVEALRPGAEVDSDAAHELLKPLTWLIERGHIIEFFNGTLSVPLPPRGGADR